MIKRKLYVLILIVLATAQFAFSQATSRLSSADAEEAVNLARQFTQTLGRNKDFAPVINELFAPDYVSRFLQSCPKTPFLFLKREVASRASRAELLRYYGITLTGGYLHSLYIYSKYPSTSDVNVPEEKQFPPGVLRVIKGSRYFKLYQHREEIESLRQLRSYIELHQRVINLLRRYLIKSKAETSREYRESIADLAERYEHYQPQAGDYTWVCNNLAKDSQIIKVNLPVLQLFMERVDGKLKIVWAQPFFQ